MAAALIPIHVVGLGALAELAGGGALLGGAHGVAVVLDDEEDGEVPEGGEVVGLVHGALVYGTVAHEGHGGAFFGLILHGVGEAGAEGDLAADDAVAAPVVEFGGEVVHRAALALGATGDLAVELGHERAGVHADGDGVAVVAVGGDDVVVLAHERAGADGDGFLADVEVEEAADLALVIDGQAALFEAADAHHLAVELDLLLGVERGVGRGLGVRAGHGDGRRGGGVFGGDGGLLAHVDGRS